MTNKEKIIDLENQVVNFHTKLLEYKKLKKEITDQRNQKDCDFLKSFFKVKDNIEIFYQRNIINFIDKNISTNIISFYFTEGEKFDEKYQTIKINNLSLQKENIKDLNQIILAGEISKILLKNQTKIIQTLNKNYKTWNNLVQNKVYKPGSKIMFKKQKIHKKIRSMVLKQAEKLAKSKNGYKLHKVIGLLKNPSIFFDIAKLNYKTKKEFSFTLINSSTEKEYTYKSTENFEGFIFQHLLRGVTGKNIFNIFDE